MASGCLLKSGFINTDLQNAIGVTVTVEENGFGEPGSHHRCRQFTLPYNPCEIHESISSPYVGTVKPPPSKGSPENNTILDIGGGTPVPDIWGILSFFWQHISTLLNNTK